MSTTYQPNENLSFLPNAGDGRLWRVSLHPTNRKLPMRVELVEFFRRTTRGTSKVIGTEYATAHQDDLKRAAAEILERVSDYEKFVGDYSHEREREKRAEG